VSGLVTVTSTAPVAWAEVMAVMVVGEDTTTLVAAVPLKLTVAPETKFVPVTVTAIPPFTDPLLGETLVTVGAGEVIDV